MLVSALPRNGSSLRIGRYRTAQTGANDAGTRYFARKSRLFDRESPGIRRQGSGHRSGSGSNGADDDMIDVLQDNGRDPVVREITGFIDALSEDEQIDLVALMRLGRGDATIEEWKDLRRQAAEGRNDRTASYLLGEPMLGDLLAEGLDEFGLYWSDGRAHSCTVATARSRR